jgi:hypothetical protein
LGPLLASCSKAPQEPAAQPPQAENQQIRPDELYTNELVEKAMQEIS